MEGQYNPNGFTVSPEGWAPAQMNSDGSIRVFVVNPAGGSSSQQTASNPAVGTAGSSNTQAMAVQRFDGVEIVSDTTGQSILTAIGKLVQSSLPITLTSLTMANATGSGSVQTFPTAGAGAMAFEVLFGTATGSVGFRVSADGGTTYVPFAPMTATSQNTGVEATTISGNALCRLNTAHYTHVQLYVATTGTGSVTIQGNQSAVTDTPEVRSSILKPVFGAVVFANAQGVLTLASPTAPMPVVQAGMWSSFSAQGGTGNALLTATPVAIKTAPGVLGGFDFVNTGSSAAWVQFFDAASASAVTLGTTVPKLAFYVPAAGSNAFGTTDQKMGDQGVGFINGIVIAATTTSTGGVAPGTGVNGNVEFK